MTPGSSAEGLNYLPNGKAKEYIPVLGRGKWGLGLVDDGKYRNLTALGSIKLALTTLIKRRNCGYGHRHSYSHCHRHRQLSYSRFLKMGKRIVKSQDVCPL